MHHNNVPDRASNALLNIPLTQVDKVDKLPRNTKPSKCDNTATWKVIGKSAQQLQRLIDCNCRHFKMW